MSRRALKRVWKPLHSHHEHAAARIRIHDSADSLPASALVRADRPTFDCPRCGWQNDRAPFCLWCLCQDDAEAREKWQRPLRRRITSPSLVCPAAPALQRRPFSSPAPAAAHQPLSTATPATLTPTATATPAIAAATTSAADDDNPNGPPANVDTTFMSIPATTSPATATTPVTPPFTTSPAYTPTTPDPDSLPAPCTPPASPLLSSTTTNRVRYHSAASAFSNASSAGAPPSSPLPWPPAASSASASPSQSPPLSPTATSTKFSAYVSRKTAEREARMHRIAECATAAAITLDISRPTSPLVPPPAPGAIALGHLLPIPGSLRISSIPPGAGGNGGGVGGSGSVVEVASLRTSLDLRSVRSREADSLYSPARSVASRSSAGVGLGGGGGGGRRSRSVHRRGESSQYSLAPPLPSPAEISDEDADADADADEELGAPSSFRRRSHSDATAGRGKRAVETVGKFFRRVGGAMHLPHMVHRDRMRGQERTGHPDAIPHRAEFSAQGTADGAAEAHAGIGDTTTTTGGVSVSAKSGVGRLLEWTSTAFGRRRRQQQQR